MLRRSRILAFGTYSQINPDQLSEEHNRITRPAPAASEVGQRRKDEEELKPKNATPYSESLRHEFDVTLVKRIHSAIDSRSMCSTDNERVISRVQCWDTMLMHFLVPIVPLQRYLHNRWEIDTIAQHHTMGPCGIMTLCASRSKLLNASWFDTMMQPKEGNIALNLRFLCLDRLHWERSLWNHRMWTKNYALGTLTRKMTGQDVEDSCPIHLETDFNDEAQTYSSFGVSAPSKALNIEVEDTGISMLDPELNITPGFADNESALRELAMATDSHHRGYGGRVFRQPAWSTPAIPTLGKLTKTDGLARFLEEELHGILPLGDCKPVATWLVRDIPEIRFYTTEAGVEEENEPNNVNLLGNQDISDRANTKALNRQRLFRAELRGKTFAESEGRDIPR